ncbi:MAG: MFS transporter [Pseudomonadota bacterium]
MKLTSLPLPLVIAFIANGLAYSFFVITLPIIGREIQFSDTNTSIILGLSALVLTIASPIWGRLCDRFGRRRVIFISMLAACVCLISSALLIYLRRTELLIVSNGFNLLLSVRLINAFFTAGLKPGGQAYVADSTSESDRAKGMGIMGAAFGIGSVIAGIVAMLSGSEYIMYAYAGIAFVVLLSCFFVFLSLPETYNIANVKADLSTENIPFLRIVPFLVITLVALCVFSLLQHITSLTLQDKFGLVTDKAIRVGGMTMMLTMVAMIATQLIVVRKLNISPVKLMGFIFHSEFSTENSSTHIHRPVPVDLRG